MNTDFDADINKLIDACDDALVKTGMRLIARLTASMPRETDSENQALIETIALIKRSFLIGVSSTKELYKLEGNLPLYSP